MITNPSFTGSLKGKINFNDLKKVLQIDSLNVAGLVDADLGFSGNIADVEAGRYEKIKAEGVVQLNDFVYDSPDFTQK
jgi:hypothetical protein